MVAVSTVLPTEMSSKIEDDCVQPPDPNGDEWAQLSRLQELLSDRQFPRASINVMHSGVDYVASLHIGRLILGSSLSYRSERQAVKEVVQNVLIAFDAITAMFDDRSGSIYGSESWPPFFRTRLDQQDDTGETEAQVDLSDEGCYSIEELSALGFLEACDENDEVEQLDDSMMGQVTPAAESLTDFDRDGVPYTSTNGADTSTAECAVLDEAAYAADAEKGTAATGEHIAGGDTLSPAVDPLYYPYEVDAGGDSSYDVDATIGEYVESIGYDNGQPLQEYSLYAECESANVDEMSAQFARLSTLDTHVGPYAGEESDYDLEGGAGQYAGAETDSSLANIEGKAVTSDEAYSIDPCTGEAISAGISGAEEASISIESTSYASNDLVVYDDAHLEGGTAQYPTYAEDVHSMPAGEAYSPNETDCGEAAYISQDPPIQDDSAVVAEEYSQSTDAVQYALLETTNGSEHDNPGDSVQDYATGPLKTQGITYAAEDGSTQYYDATDGSPHVTEQQQYISEGILNEEGRYDIAVSEAPYTAEETIAQQEIYASDGSALLERTDAQYTDDGVTIEAHQTQCYDIGGTFHSSDGICQDTVVQYGDAHERDIYSSEQEYAADRTTDSGYVYDETSGQYIVGSAQQCSNDFYHAEDSTAEFVQPDGVGVTCDGALLEPQQSYEQAYEGASQVESVAGEISTSTITELASIDEQSVTNVVPSSIGAVDGDEAETSPTGHVYTVQREELTVGNNSVTETHTVYANQSDSNAHYADDDSLKQTGIGGVPAADEAVAGFIWAQIVHINDDGYLNLLIEGTELAALRQLNIEVEWETPVDQVIIGQWYMAPRFLDENPEPSWERAVVQSYDEQTRTVLVYFGDVGIHQEVSFDDLREICNLEEVSQIPPQAELVAVKGISGANLSISKIAKLRSRWVNTTNPQWLFVLNTADMTAKEDDIPQVQLICSVSGEIVEA